MGNTSTMPEGFEPIDFNDESRYTTELSSPEETKAIHSPTLTIQEFGKEIRQSRESASAFLQRAGILDENGDLAEPYRSEK